MSACTPRASLCSCCRRWINAFRRLASFVFRSGSNVDAIPQNALFTSMVFVKSHRSTFSKINVVISTFSNTRSISENDQPESRWYTTIRTRCALSKYTAPPIGRYVRPVRTIRVTSPHQRHDQDFFYKNNVSVR